MTPNLIVMPTKIPQHIPEIPIYRTFKYATCSYDEKEFQEYLKEKEIRYSKLFQLKGYRTDHGDRILFEDDKYELEIYRPSDSFVLCDKKNRYRIEVPSESKLPTEKEASDIAVKKIKSLGLDTTNAKFKSVDYSMNYNEIGGKTETIKTEAHANFIFFLDKFRVFGPGAKIKISFIEDNRISGILNFWRLPSAERHRIKTIAPEEALNRLAKYGGFNNLAPDKAQVILDKIELGYYSLPPMDFQRFMIPVYAIRGEVKSRVIHPYEFVRYVVASDMPFENIKEMSVVDNPYHCGVI